MRIRMRRYRRTEGLRALNRETNLHPDDLILPVFAVPGQKRREPVHSMPGIERMSPDLLVRRLAESPESLRAVLVFGVPDGKDKDGEGSAAADENGLVPETVRAIKRERPDIVVITDVCLCGYTDHGHCGILMENGEVDNDRTLHMLAATAAVHAAAGADMVAPSAMMDGQTAAIRSNLDGCGFHAISIMSYSTKFASAFYGPFRDAARSSPARGDRKGYQLPPANRREALRESLLDEAEGADWLMIKPAMPYLDVLRDLREATLLPLAAYQVSGEYAMLKHASASGALNERSCVLECLLSMKRAGADAIITYYAEEALAWLD